MIFQGLAPFKAAIYVTHCKPFLSYKIPYHTLEISLLPFKIVKNMFDPWEGTPDDHFACEIRHSNVNQTTYCTSLVQPSWSPYCPFIRQSFFPYPNFLHSKLPYALLWSFGRFLFFISWWRPCIYHLIKTLLFRDGICERIGCGFLIIDTDLDRSDKCNSAFTFRICILFLLPVRLNLD